MVIVRFVYLLALGLWIGEIAFFSFVVAPAIFRVLGAAGAGDVVGAIFPSYYALGIAAAALAVVSGAVLSYRAGSTGLWTAALLVLALGLGATLWAGIGVYPAARRLRAAANGPVSASPVAAEFDRLHHRAVALNAASLLAALTGLGLSAGALRT